MKIIDQTLHLIDNSYQRVDGVARDIAKTAHATLVLAYAGVIAIIKGQSPGEVRPCPNCGANLNHLGTWCANPDCAWIK